MSELPTIVVASGSMEASKSLIKNICHKDTFETSEAGVPFCTWSIDNKYYSTELKLLALEDPSSVSAEDEQYIEAFLLHVNWDTANIDEEYQKWKIILDDTLPEIKILLFDNEADAQDRIVSRVAREWCLKRNFEFVDLNSEGDISDNAFELTEAEGFDRVIEALHSHTWSNLTLKSTEVHQRSDHNTREDEMSEFTNLFAQLQSMKDSVQSLPASQRRECAEQVVKAFWQAIGGDESEIDDIIE